MFYSSNSTWQEGGLGRDHHQCGTVLSSRALMASSVQWTPMSVAQDSTRKPRVVGTSAVPNSFAELAERLGPGGEYPGDQWRQLGMCRGCRTWTGHLASSSSTFPGQNATA